MDEPGDVTLTRVDAEAGTALDGEVLPGQPLHPRREHSAAAGPLPEVAPEPRDDPRIPIAAIIEHLVDLLRVHDQLVSFRKLLNFVANTSACDTGTSSSSAP